MATSPMTSAHLRSGRWPLQEKRCQEWTAALKQLEGEYTRDRSTETYFRTVFVMLICCAAYFAYLTAFGDYLVAWWVVAAITGMTAVLAALIARRIGVRYRIATGTISEISAAGKVRWSEPLINLTTVRFPLIGVGRGPPQIELHWTTHRRSIELYRSMVQAVADVMHRNASAPAESYAASSWRCQRCNEPNPTEFELCWKCGSEGYGVDDRYS